MSKIAFIGLGHMGGGMAPNLAKAGHEVRAFDLSEDALARAAVAVMAVRHGNCSLSWPTRKYDPLDPRLKDVV